MELSRSGELTGIDPTGNATIQRFIASVKESGAAGKVHYLTNNLPYAYRLEYGWSRQAPNGMVGVTVVEFQSIVNAAAKDVNR
jgi:hypothetical protein